jgi:hypothetical protein
VGEHPVLTRLISAFVHTCALGTLLAATAAAADTALDDAKHVQAVIDSLRAGDVSAAVAKLRAGPSADALAAKPHLVHVLCDRAFRFDSQSAPIDARRALAASLFEIATKACEAQPSDDRPRWGLAEAIVLRERSTRSGPDAWGQAADLLEKIHAGRPGDALPLGYAVSCLLEGACCEDNATSSLAERADSLARRAMESQKDSATLAVTIASSQFWCAKTLLPTNKRVAKNELKASLDTLRPFATRPNPPLAAATAYNDAVAFARVSGFVLSDRFVDFTRATLSNSIQIDVPVSSRWSFQTVAATGDQAAYDYVTEMSPDGKRTRQVLFRRYAWGSPYTFEESNPVGGDNCRGIAHGLQEQLVKRVFAPGAKGPAPSRCSIPKSLDGYSFDVRGATPAADGAASEPLRLRVYVLRGSAKACYALLVYVYGKDDELGPEIEHLVASLREVEK